MNAAKVIYKRAKEKYENEKLFIARTLRGNMTSALESSNNS